MITLSDCKDLYKETFYIQDKNDTILDLLVAIAMSAHTKSDPIWLMIIGPPSGGKTSLIDCIYAKLSFAHFVSTLTENALLSGMGTGDGKEKSLIHKMGKTPLMVMKDFTSILSLKEELKTKILADLREIYDGKISKATGNGKDTKWEGKLTFVGAVTDAIYLGEGDDASMGKRTADFIMPHLTEEDRINMAERSADNIGDISEKRKEIQTIFADFINEKVKDMPIKMPKLPKELVSEIIKVANFSTIMRTATSRNFHGELNFVPSHEAPMRLSNQLIIMMQILIYLNDGVMRDEYKAIVIKIAMDSIPRQRTVTLEIMAKYDGVMTKGVAQALLYPSKTVLNWLEDINCLGGCSRSLLGHSDIWKMKKSYQDIMIEYGNVKFIGGDLVGDESSDDYRNIDDSMDPVVLVEYEKNSQQAFDSNNF